MKESADFIFAPWNPEQVKLLNMFQKSGRGHPYTCGGGGGPCSGVDMQATTEGWKCPKCGRIQTDVLIIAIELAKMLDEKGWPDWRGRLHKQEILAELEKEEQGRGFW